MMLIFESVAKNILKITEKWDEVFKNGQSETCERESLKI